MWVASPADQGFLSGCTDGTPDGTPLSSFASMCLGAPGFRVEQTGSDLTVPPQVVQCAGSDTTVSGTGTRSSTGLVEIVLRFEVHPPLGPILRWESFAGMAQRDTFPLAWHTVDYFNSGADGACLISPPEPVTFTITP